LGRDEYRLSSKGDPQLTEISRKLDVLIRISALNLVRDIKLQKDRIALLSYAGFQPTQIANFLGTTPNTVNVALHSIRKERAEKESKEKEQEPAAEIPKTSDEKVKEENSGQRKKLDQF
jgi:hypothetical protein